MDFTKPVSVREIGEWIDAQLIGQQDQEIIGINEIHKVRKGDITFVDHPKYYASSLASAASAVIVPTEMECPPGKTLLVTEQPFLAYESIVKKYRHFTPIALNITEGDEIDPSAIIEPGAIIGHPVRIGKDCHIQAGAVLRPFTYLGDRVVIHSGAMIGVQAFYFKKWPDHYQPWTACGRVIIEDDVWIGAGTTIAMGVSGDTIIGAGTKIDCQVMIGHGVVIGKHCILAGQVGIAGKTVVGDWCVIYGQAGLTQNLHIGDRTIIMAQSGVTKDLEGNKSYFGSPAEEARTKFKELYRLKELAKNYAERNKEE